MLLVINEYMLLLCVAEVGTVVISQLNMIIHIKKEFFLGIAFYAQASMLGATGSTNVGIIF